MAMLQIYMYVTKQGFENFREMAKPVLEEYLVLFEPLEAREGKKAQASVVVH